VNILSAALLMQTDIVELYPAKDRQIPGVQSVLRRAYDRPDDPGVPGLSRVPARAGSPVADKHALYQGNRRGLCGWQDDPRQYAVL